MRLPNGYQEVEWIQSSGTQYINTGQSFDCQNTIVEMRFQMPDVSYSSLSSRPRFYGVSNGTNEYSLQANRDSITSLAANSYLNNSTYQISATVSKGVDHISKHYASGVWYVDGVSKGSKSHGDYSTGDNPMFIFEVNWQGQAMDRKMILRLYRFKIYNGDTLQRDFVPCYRKSDGEIGLYDLIGNQFYTNQGTGTFTKGNDVGPSGKIKRIYLGTNLIRPPEITETYTRTPFQSSVSIYKSDYKIKQAIMEWEGRYTGSNWYITEPKINSSSVIFSCVMSVGGSYGYNYGDGQGRYGGIRIQASGTYTGIVSVNSGATTSSQNAGRVIITPEAIEYHIGKTFDNWLQEGTATPSSTISGNITTLFNSNDVTINGSCWNSSTSTFNFYRCIVTYEPI